MICYCIKHLKKGEKFMESVMEKALRCKIQKKIIMLLYQSEERVNATYLTNILQSSRSSVSNVTRGMRDKGILDYQEDGKYRYFSLTQEAIDYLHKYHPEINSAEMITNLTGLNSRESIAASKMTGREETVQSVNNHPEINPELREYYIKAIELLKLPNYMNLLANYSLKEALLLSLFIICYLENKKFNFSDIALLFNISEDEVLTTYRKTLLMLKEKVNETINNLLSYTPEVPQPKGNHLK